jgi:hypothetical protein
MADVDCGTFTRFHKYAYVGDYESVMNSRDTHYLNPHLKHGYLYSFAERWGIHALKLLMLSNLE